MTIEEFFKKLQEVDDDLTLELVTPQVFEIIYNDYPFICMDFEEEKPKFKIDYLKDEIEDSSFEVWEADTVIGALKVVKEFMENYDD